MIGTLSSSPERFVVGQVRHRRVFVPLREETPEVDRAAARGAGFRNQTSLKSHSNILIDGVTSANDDCGTILYPGGDGQALEEIR